MENEDFADLREFYTDDDGVCDYNQGDWHGDTVLMDACDKGKTELIEFLLEDGANPNRRNEDGDTALHKACAFSLDVEEDDEEDEADEEEETKCRKNSSLSKDERVKYADQKSLQMIKIFLDHGASFRLNINGLHPVDLAALEGKAETVAYFLVNKLLSKFEEIRAMELLAFSLALNNKCRDAYLVLVKAMKKRHDDPDKPIFKDFTSNLEGFVGQEECRTLEDLKALQTSKHGITIEAMLKGDRHLPPSMKEERLYERLVDYGMTLLVRPKRMEQGFRIVHGCLHLDMEDLDVKTSALSTLYKHLEEAPPSGLRFKHMPKYVGFVCRLLKAFLGVFKERRVWYLEDIGHTVSNVSYILYYAAIVCDYEMMKLMDALLVPISEIILAIWQRIPKPEAPPRQGDSYTSFSVAQVLLGRLASEYFADSLFRMTECIQARFKRLIAHFIQIEGALEIDCFENTMVHTAMMLINRSEESQNCPFVIDLTKMLIRHGCPTQTKNEGGETPEVMANRYGLTHPRKKELYRLLNTPEEVLPLQELASRAILYHRIPYRCKVPRALQKVIDGPFLEED